MNTQSNDEKVPLIRYPRFKELHEEIRLCQRMTKITGEPQCISLEGMPGAGKSTLVTDYVSNFPRQETKDGAVIPIFYTVTPSPVTVKGMASHMLKKMGDPAADKGTLTSMNSRLIGLIVDCGVELVILDDFHHLIDSETNRILSSVSDWLKVLIKETNIPYMVIGVENTIEMILDTNKQLSRLFASRLDLEPFKWDPANQTTIQEFDRFIHYVEQARLPLDKSLSRLELLYRICFL